MQVGDLVKVSVPTNQLREEDNWSDSVSNGSVGIVTDASSDIIAVNIPEHGECWYYFEDLEILN